MASTGQDFSCFAGDDLELDVSLFEADGTTELDISGMSVEWQFSSVYSQDALITKTSDEGTEITVDDPVFGLLTVKISSADTVDKGGMPYRHILRIYEPITKKSTVVLTGGATISKAPRSVVAAAPPPSFAGPSPNAPRTRISLVGSRA